MPEEDKQVLRQPWNLFDHLILQYLSMIIISNIRDIVADLDSLTMKVMLQHVTCGMYRGTTIPLDASFHVCVVQIHELAVRYRYGVKHN